MLLLNLCTAFFMLVASNCKTNSNSSSNRTDEEHPKLSKTVYHEPVWKPPIALPLTKGVAAPDRPFYVKVHNVDINGYCGGVVLKFPRHVPALVVITAAHCISEYICTVCFKNMDHDYNYTPSGNTRHTKQIINNNKTPAEHRDFSASTEP